MLPSPPLLKRTDRRILVKHTHRTSAIQYRKGHHPAVCRRQHSIEKDDNDTCCLCDEDAQSTLVDAVHNIPLGTSLCQSGKFDTLTCPRCKTSAILEGSFSGAWSKLTATENWSLVCNTWQTWAAAGQSTSFPNECRMYPWHYGGNSQHSHLFLHKNHKNTS